RYADSAAESRSKPLSPFPNPGNNFEGLRAVLTPPTLSVEDQPGAAAQKGSPLWTFTNRRGHSALFAGVRSLQEDNTVLCLGYVGDIYDQEGNYVAFDSLSPEYVDALKTQLREEKNCIPVIVPEVEAVGHYEGYCKNGKFALLAPRRCVLLRRSCGIAHVVTAATRSLAPLPLHPVGRDLLTRWLSYISLATLVPKGSPLPGSALLRRALVDLASCFCSPVWIHDYHLLLAPSMLRAKVPDALIAFFLH
ncbi:MAG: hypothetical protein BJ554DRAFT_6737, partial [Olpidium bornovanus]